VQRVRDRYQPQRYLQQLVHVLEAVA